MSQSITSFLRRAWKRMSAAASRRRPRVAGLAIEILENRITPVLGAFDIPIAIEPGGVYDGVVDVGVATGALLSTGRHVLTAGHVGDQNTGPGSGSASKFTILTPTGSRTIATPSLERFPHPQYGGDPDIDMAILELAELAPLTVNGYDLYTDTDELNHVATLVGYGHTGTGTTGVATDIKLLDTHATDTGTETNYQLVRFTVTGNPTGGFFAPRLADEIPGVLVGVPYNTSAAQLETALEALPDMGDVQVRLVGDIDFDGEVDNFGHPYAGSFEALFLGAPNEDHSMADVVATHTFTGGNNPNIVIQRILEGGTPRGKRSGTNYIGEVTDTRLRADFDDGYTDPNGAAPANILGDDLGQGAAEAFNSGGDSGAPIFINGLIAGVHKGRFEPGYDNNINSLNPQTSDFGEVNTYIRVSTELDFFDLLDDPFDLVLNMVNQPWGDDEDDDTIAFSRVGNTLRIHIDGVLRYTENIGLIQSVTIFGSGDNETITVGDLGNMNIVVEGKGGNDTIHVSSGANVSLDGGAGDDTFTIGQSSGSTFDDISGHLTVLGGSGSDYLTVNDANGFSDEYSIQGIENGELVVQGRIDATDYAPGKMFLYGGVEHVELQANIDPNQITVSDIAFDIIVTIFAGFNDDTVLVSDLASDVTVNVHGGADDDTISVWNVADGATVNVYGDALNLPGGNDTLTLGNGNLGTVQGSVFFDGTGSTDLLVLDDSDAPAPAGRDYQFTLGSVTATGFGGVTYSNRVEKVRLDGSSQVDTVNVEALDAATDLELYGHDGSDVFFIAENSENVDSVLGDVVIHGGDAYPPSFLPHMAFPEDDDQLYVRDDKSAAAGSFTFNLHLGNVLVGRVNKLGANPSDLPPSVIYDQIERTELHTGAGADNISVVAAPRFNQVSVFAGIGIDQIDVESTPLFAAAMQIFGEQGQDTVRVSPIAQNLGNLHSLLSVDGGSDLAAELDSLSVYDTLSGNAAAYTLDSSSLSRPGSAGVAFGKVENLFVSLSNAANVMNVSATAAGKTVTIHGNAGNDTLTASNLASSVTFVGGAGLDDRAILVGTNGHDTINVNGDTMTLGAGSLTGLVENREAEGLGGMDTFNVGNGDVDSIGGELELHGGNDSDALIINDQDDLGNDTYTVTVNQVSKPNFLLLYDDMESLTLNAGANNNTINIDSTSSGTSVIVNAGVGGDTIHLSPTAQNLSLIDGPVTVNGQQGVDTVFLHEEQFALGGFFPYTITHSTVSRSFFGGLSFDTIERLRLNLGTGNNTVNVTEFNRDVLFALFGNVGADTFNVTVHPTLMDTGGRLFIDGGGNGDQLNVAYATKPQVPNKPNVHHKKNPPLEAGTITVEYPEEFYDIQYTSVSEVNVDKI